MPGASSATVNNSTTDRLADDDIPDVLLNGLSGYLTCDRSSLGVPLEV